MLVQGFVLVKNRRLGIGLMVSESGSRKAMFGTETDTLAKEAVSGLAEKRRGNGRLRNA